MWVSFQHRTNDQIKNKITFNNILCTEHFDFSQKCLQDINLFVGQYSSVIKYTWIIPHVPWNKPEILMCVPVLVNGTIH